LSFVRRAPETEGGRLLRFLQLRVRALLAGAAGAQLLRLTL